MSEKDIKTKPQTTTKSVKNAPKSVEHSAKQAAWDIKTVAKDTLVKNAIDKQLDTKHSEQPQRAEVEATEQVESTYYSAVDTMYQKGKSLAENKLKQHRQQVKAKDNADTHNIPQADISEVQNTPKQADNTPKTKESVKNTDSSPKTNNSVAQVKTKEAYIKSQKSQKAENTADTVKTKQNYINAHKNAEIKDGVKQNPSVSTPKTRENTSISSAPTPKTKEQAIKDARKKYVSEKLKTKDEAEKSASENYTADIPKQNAELIKTETSAPKSDFTTDKIGRAHV